MDRPIRESNRRQACEESHESAGKLLVIAALVLFGALMRLVPHDWNFAPLGAIALFAGAHIRNRLWAVLTPLAALLLSDVLMHLTWVHKRPGFYPGMEFTYLAFVAVAGVGMFLNRPWRTPFSRVAAIAGATMVGSLVFFLISNFGSWVSYYPHTWHGLFDCYLVKAPPFYRATLLGDLIYVPLLFGTFGLTWHLVPAWSPAPRSERGP